METGFMFFPSYALVVSYMNAEQKAMFLDGLIAIASGDDFDVESVPDKYVMCALAMAKPNVKKDVGRRVTAKKGGRPKSEKLSEKLPEKLSEKQRGEERRGEEWIGKERETYTANFNDENPHIDIEGEFEKLWKIYPKKTGRQIALQYYAVARAEEGVEYEDVEEGIRAYNRHIEDAKVKTQYIMSGSRYFGEARWNDVYNDGVPEEDDGTYF